MITIKNDAQVKAVLQTITLRHAKNLTRSTIHGVAGEIRDQVKFRAPDDPYTSRNDIVRTTKSKRERERRGVFRSSVRIGAFYWRYHEWGTVKMHARPFVRPSVDVVWPHIAAIFRRQFGQKLEAMLARQAKQAAKK